MVTFSSVIWILKLLHTLGKNNNKMCMSDHEMYWFRTLLQFYSIPRFHCMYHELNWIHIDSNSIEKKRNVNWWKLLKFACEYGVGKRT
jgi:hypothetical protein